MHKLQLKRMVLDMLMSGDESAQHFLLKHGIIYREYTKERCGAQCACADTGDFPQYCLRLKKEFK